MIITITNVPEPVLECSIDLFFWGEEKACEHAVERAIKPRPAQLYWSNFFWLRMLC